MNPRLFKTFGVILLSFDLLNFNAFFADTFWAVHSNASQQRVKMLVASVVVAVIGFGLIGLRRWAAVYFSLALFCVGFWLAWSSIEQVSFPWNLLYMLEGVSLMSPAVVTIRLWPYLRSGGKWFF